MRDLTGGIRERALPIAAAIMRSRAMDLRQEATEGAAAGRADPGDSVNGKVRGGAAKTARDKSKDIAGGLQKRPRRRRNSSGRGKRSPSRLMGFGNGETRSRGAMRSGGGVAGAIQSGRRCRDPSAFRKEAESRSTKAVKAGARDRRGVCDRSTSSAAVLYLRSVNSFKRRCNITGSMRTARKRMRRATAMASSISSMGLAVVECSRNRGAGRGVGRGDRPDPGGPRDTEQDAESDRGSRARRSMRLRRP